MDDTINPIIDIWQPASARPLTSGDAQEILANLTGFIKVLADWSEQDELDSQLREARG